MENWCGKHMPVTDTCPRDDLRLKELHDDEIERFYGVKAIFYCPVFACDMFEYDTPEHHPAYYLSKAENVNLLKRDVGTLAKLIFKYAVRQKILYHKLALREGDGK